MGKSKQRKTKKNQTNSNEGMERPTAHAVRKEDPKERKEGKVGRMVNENRERMGGQWGRRGREEVEDRSRLLV